MRDGANNNPDDELVFEDSELSFSSDSDASSDSQSATKQRNISNESLVGSELTRTLRKLRQLLWLVLFGIMGVSTIGIYWFSFHYEQSIFQTEFEGHGMKILAKVIDDAHKKLEAMNSLSTFATLYAIENGEKWPMVTISHSAMKLEGYLPVIGAEALRIIPIVQPHVRAEWEEYSVQKESWIDEALQETSFSDNDEHESGNPANHEHEHRRLEVHNGDIETIHDMLSRQRERLANASESNETSKEGRSVNNGIPPVIHDDAGIDASHGPTAVLWQYAPISADRSVVNYNHYSDATFQDETAPLVEHQKAAMSHVFTLGNETLRNDPMRVFLEKLVSSRDEPLVHIYYPVFEFITRNSETVAVLSATISWKSYFADVLPHGVNGVVCVVANSKGQAFSFQIDGPNATFLGLEDLHDRAYDHLELVGNFKDSHHGDESGNVHSNVPLDTEHISYSVRIYPSAALEANYHTGMPFVVSFSMVLLFGLTAFIFQTYDGVVRRRQAVVVAQATLTDDIVASMFPSTVRSRIMGDDGSGLDGGSGHAKPGNIMGGSGHSKQAKGLSGPSTHSHGFFGDKSNVIADFYPEATVLFTDIKGFTAWCSEREPSQVFILLETLYNTYDMIAKRRKVFKVETIGDCYMAVTGVPEAQADHAVIMCKFARECLSRMHGLLVGLEATTLGPGTADLSMRFGIHSGPVTAGVIRSQNARFQLFGDTVNTAARMESNGEAERIHISEDTAVQLAAHGKAHWYTPRPDKILAKGKGELQTYWLRLSVEDDAQSSASTHVAANRHSEPSVKDAVEVKPLHASSLFEGQTIAVTDDQTSRVIDWVVDTLSALLQQVVAQRLYRNDKKQMALTSLTDSTENAPNSPWLTCNSWDSSVTASHAPIPTFDTTPVDDAAASAALEYSVVEELYNYVYVIVSMYNNHAFHNFEHAAHVTMSVTKLLGRMEHSSLSDNDSAALAFGDPLTRLACVMAAVVHNVGHAGVSNAQLMRENDKYAALYGSGTDGSSDKIAAQVALSVSWRLLWQPEYDNLRAAINRDEAELNRFHYVLSRAILATDASVDSKVDTVKEQQRDQEWQRAFDSSVSSQSTKTAQQPRVYKSMLVLDQIMQASALSHTMQHWQVYVKWNNKLLDECMVAHQNGRFGGSDSDNQIDPLEDWYERELDRFDHCILPIAYRLKECGVLGMASEEYVKYASKNRDEWAATGQELVREMLTCPQKVEL